MSRLTDLFAQFEGVEDIERAFVDQVLQAAGRRDADLPEAIRICALPRHVDEQVFSVLRGEHSDPRRDRELLDLVVKYPFALPRAEGGFVLHDNTRDALLRGWRATPEDEERFVNLNLRLADHYQGQYDEAVEADQHLRELAALIKRADPARFRRLNSLIRSRRSALLLGSLYHRLLASLDGGMSFLQMQFERLEATNDIGLNKSLITAGRDFMTRLPPDQQQPEHLAWIDYFDERLSRATDAYDVAHAERTFLRLSQDEKLPKVLRRWALGELASTYELELKTPEALRARQELATTWRGVDVYNDPLSSKSLGTLLWQIEDRDQAVIQFQEAIRSADEEPGARRDIRVLARADLSGVYSELGEWEKAFDVANEAFHLARTEFSRDPVMQYEVARRFASLLSSFDPLATDTARHEATRLLEEPPALRAAVMLEHVLTLVRAGRLRAAQDAVDGLAQDLESDPDPAAERDLLAARASVLAAQGREGEAVPVYTRILDAVADRPEAAWSRAAARSNRGIALRILGRYDAADVDLQYAIEEWTRFGLDAVTASVRIELADSLRGQGHLNAAAEALDQVDAELPPGPHFARADLQRSRAELYEQRGLWQEARDRYEESLHIHDRLRALTAATRLLLGLMRAAGGAADWSAVTAFAERATRESGRLAAIDAFSLSATDREALDLNAEAMRCCVTTVNRDALLDQARELLRSAALKSPGNVWPQLNLSYVLAEQEDWRGALDALGQALAAAPEPMRTAVLFDRLQTYALRQAQLLHHRHESEAAEGLLHDVMEQVAGHLAGGDVLVLWLAESAIRAGAGGWDAGEAVHDPRAEPLVAGIPDWPAWTPTAIETLRSLVRDSADCWAVIDLIDRLEERAGAPPAWRVALAEARAAMWAHLEETFGLGSSPAGVDDVYPVVTPIAGEVGDALVPIVDSRRDHGHFLYELIPDLRARILADTGVTVPGVRMRGNPALAPDGYVIQIFEVPVLSGSLDPGGFFAVVPQPPEGPPAPRVDVHPLTGGPGTWSPTPPADSGRSAEDGPVPAPLFLAYRIEAAVRSALWTFFGYEEGASLLAAWESDGAGELLASVAPDDAARFRLLRLLRALVEDSVPLTDWRRVLESVQEAGGTGAAVTDLVRAVRRRCYDLLPGNEAGTVRIGVPKDVEGPLVAAMSRPLEAGTATAARRYKDWLADMRAQTPGRLAVVTGTEEARRAAEHLTRSAEFLVPVLAAEELVDPAEAQQVDFVPGGVP
ncbi:FHIPEP family type III secretion protein [Geodermatophilus sp. URMC 63]